MCQLLGMNCNVPTDICFSFTGFKARGGLTDHHKDGWGIAFFEGRGVRQFLDSQASAHSPLADLVKSYPIKSKNVIAHIRKATQGTVSLENTHPFQRELWGRYWIFAHNGDVPTFEAKLDGSFLPVGETDSEKVFCWFLQELKIKFQNQNPGSEELFSFITELTLKVAPHGAFNFLLSNGDVLFAHCSTKLAYILRKAPFKSAHLKDEDVVVDLSKHTTTLDRVALVATQPLTLNEEWIAMTPGSLWLFHEGEVLKQVPTLAGPAVNPAL